MTSLPQQAASRLREVGGPSEVPVLLGFDGFIDTILHVVDMRRSAQEYTRVPTLAAFGERIAAAAGKSTNIELVVQDVKLGGNGPIMANAMAALGTRVTYCGMTGHPRTHEIFAELSQRARLLPIADPALSDAYEFDDGKLIAGKHATVAEVSFENLLERVGVEDWTHAWHEARFVAMVNWTMLPHLTELWQRLQSDFGGGERKLLFFDLADPEKRTRDDLHEALETIAHFQDDHDVILGLNEKEALQVAQVLEVAVSFTEVVAEGDSNQQMMVELARGIRQQLDLAECVIHPTAFAAAASSEESLAVEGPYVEHPKISTGAGDHFNAGYCLGRLLGCDVAQSLQIGVGTSGYYVRNAQSPTREELAEFLEML